jgi:hypothetical protein
MTSPTIDLLAVLKTKIHAQTAASDGDHDDIKEAKAATAMALNDLLLRVSQTAKEEMVEKTRLELDAALFDDREGLKWPLLNALKCCALYRAFLGLPQTLEQTRRFFTNVSANKMSNILEEGLIGQDLLSSTCHHNTQTLQWVEQVLVYLTGAGRFKKDLGGFDLKGPAKNKVKCAINQVKKHRQELEKTVQTQMKSQSLPIKVQGAEMPRDFRLDDKDRESARVSGIEAMVDQALSVKKTQGTGKG